jgi:DNA-binding Lrp family transcriptional regulator
MKKLEESGYIKRTEALLSRFYKDKESTKAKPIEASAKRPIGAEVSEV